MKSLGGDAGEVLAAVEELSYRPNLLARGLKTRRTYTIGLLIPDIQNFFSLPLCGVWKTWR